MAPEDIFTRFENRSEAGHRLAEQLSRMTIDDPIVIALPRGGVPVALPVALTLGAPLDILVVRKIGHPLNPEYGVGALTEDGRVWLNPELKELRTLPGLSEIIEHERQEVLRRVHLYRAGCEPVDVAGRNVILVDDGLATGATARVAVRHLRDRGAKHIILASPVCAEETAHALEGLADVVLCLARPEQFYAVGVWYHEFPQLSDREVLEMLKQAPHEAPLWQKEESLRTKYRGGRRP